MVKARKEGALSVSTKPAAKNKDGAKHAAAMVAALEYYRSKAGSHAEECKNWPFSVTADNVAEQLKAL